MALTPEDVVNKRFETTRFRDGYDQDEVDDFLDEVVSELRRLTTENEELRARVSELESGAGASQAAPAGDESHEAPVEAASLQAETVEAPAAEPEVAEVEQAPAAPAASSSGADSLLALAQRVHDEHVHEGETKRDELIAAAEQKAADIEAQAEQRKGQLTTEFENEKAQLEQKKAQLEAKIDELKSFERDYRLKLRGYIESQLRDLDRSSSLAFGGSGSQS